MWRTDSLEKTLMLGKIEGRRRRGWQRVRWLDGITDQWTWVWTSSGGWWWTGKPGILQSNGSQRVRHNWATELNWNNVLVESLGCFTVEICVICKWTILLLPFQFGCLLFLSLIWFIYLRLLVLCWIRVGICVLFLISEENFQTFPVEYYVNWASLVVLVVKNLPANAEDIWDWGSIP